MPTASTELQNLMIERFGGLDDHPPIKALEASGYTLHRDWTWSHPTVKSLADMSKEDWLCLIFLCHEWDFGSLRTGVEPCPE